MRAVLGGGYDKQLSAPQIYRQANLPLGSNDIRMLEISTNLEILNYITQQLSMLQRAAGVNWADLS